MQAQAGQRRTRRYWWLIVCVVGAVWLGWNWLFSASESRFDDIRPADQLRSLDPVEAAQRTLHEILGGAMLPEELQQALEDYTEAVAHIRASLPESEFRSWQSEQQHQINQAAIDPGLRQHLLAIVDPTSITPFIGPSATPTPTPTATATHRLTPIPSATHSPASERPTPAPVVATNRPAITLEPSVQIPSVEPTAIPATAIRPTPTATDLPLATDVPLPTITALPPSPTAVRASPTPTVDQPTRMPYPYPYPSSR